VRAMLTEHSDRIHAWLDRKTATAPSGPERVLAVFDVLIEWFAQPGYCGCAVINTATDTRMDPEIAAIARRHLTRYRVLLEDRLRDLDIDDPPALARQLLLLIEGASVITTIDGTPAAGVDARNAATELIRAEWHRKKKAATTSSP
jgi:AcrR family transcriptional regulator